MTRRTTGMFVFGYECFVFSDVHMLSFVTSGGHNSSCCAHSENNLKGIFTSRGYGLGSDWTYLLRVNCEGVFERNSKVNSQYFGNGTFTGLSLRYSDTSF